ncbi:MAG: adenosylhomocysteinase [Candidatus Kuenenia sp.]|nr:adenosylhomocysteinase [Candidatus Kuenenia hertensis]
MPEIASDIKDISLSDKGQARIEWALNEMPVIRNLMERFSRERPLEGVRMSGCLHITTETANLARVLILGGADLVLCASNPLSTQDDVAAALVAHYQIPTFAVKGEDNQRYYQHINAALDHCPQLTMDDGADLVSEMHKNRKELLNNMLGGTEETTTGVIRLRAMAREGALKYPIIAVNDAMTKHLFDNRYGTGQSTIDGIVRATNILLAGKVFTVAGYGWCGRGIAMRAKGLGANVIIAEVDPIRALEAVMDGYRVMPVLEASALSDFIVTATGDKHVIDQSHFEVMKDGCVLANSGHFNVEINIPALVKMAVSKQQPREYVHKYRLPSGHTICLLAEGRLVNLVAAEGHPSAVMDMSFANQALCAVFLYTHKETLENKVLPVPVEIDHVIAQLKLKAMNTRIDTLTEEQTSYLSSWQEGT